MEATTIFLSISITVNFFLIGVVLILWFRKCKECGRDKEISKAFSKFCDKCERKDGNGSNGNNKKKHETL